MMDRSMGDEELDQIEREVEGYELENFPISGVQLSAIIQRLRLSEEALRITRPVYDQASSEARLRRANAAWAYPRLAAMLLALAGGFTGGWLAYLVNKTRAEIIGSAASNDLIEASFVSISFTVPTITIGFLLLTWIERVASRRLAAGAYDAED